MLAPTTSYVRYYAVHRPTATAVISGGQEISYQQVVALKILFHEMLKPPWAGSCPWDEYANFARVPDDDHPRWRGITSPPAASHSSCYRKPTNATFKAIAVSPNHWKHQLKTPLHPLLVNNLLTKRTLLSRWYQRILSVDGNFHEKTRTAATAGHISAQSRDL